MKYTTTILCSLAAAALALPPPRPIETCYTDTYDDLAPGPLGFILPATSPVGQYHGLQYTNFAVNNPGKNAGFIPATGKQTAGSAIDQALLNSLGGSLPSSTPSFVPFGTLKPAAGSGATTFDLQYFYFACALITLEQVVGDAESCTISVYGYYRDDSQAPVQTFTFLNVNNPNNAMLLAKLPTSFRGLKNATIGVANGATLTAGTVLEIDNLSHCAYE